MEARTGNRTPPRTLEPSPERRALRPLAFILFKHATEVPGIRHRVTRMVAGEPVELAEPKVVAPQPFFDSEARLVVIKDRWYPLETIESFSFARAAKKDT